MRNFRSACSLSSMFMFANVMAQIWAPTGAVWHYRSSSAGGFVGAMRIEVTGDTVVSGLAATILHKQLIGYDYAQQQEVNIDRGNEVTRSQDSVVYIYDPYDAEFDTLFDLKASPGASWRLADRPTPYVCDSSSRVTVFDTGTSTVDGVPLKWLHVSIAYHSEDHQIPDQLDTLYERIGPLATYMLPHDLCNSYIDGQEAGELRCYHDAILHVQLLGVTACDAPLGIGSRTPASGFRVFPNPGSEWISIVLNAGGIARVRFFDATGRDLLGSRSFIEPMRMYVGSLASGAYLIELTDPSGIRSWEQWIKE